MGRLKPKGGSTGRSPRVGYPFANCVCPKFAGYVENLFSEFHYNAPYRSNNKPGRHPKSGMTASFCIRKVSFMVQVFRLAFQWEFQ